MKFKVMLLFAATLGCMPGIINCIKPKRSVIVQQTKLAKRFVKGYANLVTNRERVSHVDDFIMYHCFHQGEMFVYPAFQFQFNRNQIDSNYIFLYNPAYRYMKLNLIIHGWVDGFPSTYKVNDEGWMLATARAWAANQYSGVTCAVEWPQLACFEYSYTAKKIVYEIAESVADFILVLGQIHGPYFIDGVSVAGNSIAGPLMGFLGHYVFSKTLRTHKILAIYAFDPAGPLYNVKFRKHYEEPFRLSKEHAHHVQVLHTDKFFGTLHACGHSDFYFHLGISQPGCINPLCSHMKSINYFIASLNPANVFWGVLCPNDMSYARKKIHCLPGYQPFFKRLGIHNQDWSEGRFYLEVNENFPYCINC